jgi:hypothetical protein
VLTIRLSYVLPVHREPGLLVRLGKPVHPESKPQIQVEHDHIRLLARACRQTREGVPFIARLVPPLLVARQKVALALFSPHSSPVWEFSVRVHSILPTDEMEGKIDGGEDTTMKRNCFLA